MAVYTAGALIGSYLHYPGDGWIDGYMEVNSFWDVQPIHSGSAEAPIIVSLYRTNVQFSKDQRCSFLSNVPHCFPLFL